MRTNPRVLVVESDPELRDTVGSWLEGSGFDVSACPGPSGPEFVCVGDRAGHCPLIEGTDAVVLDCDLPSDQVLEGTSSVDLLALYVSAGLPVVAMGGGHLARVFGEDGVLFLDRTANGGIVGAVKRVIGLEPEES
jgi:CheY-like chemotaxis protein